MAMDGAQNVGTTTVINFVALFVMRWYGGVIVERYYIMTFIVNVAKEISLILKLKRLFVKISNTIYIFLIS